MAPDTQTRDATIITRVEPDLAEAVEQLARGNGLSKSEVTRLLIRAGIRATAEREQGAPLSGSEAHSDVARQAAERVPWLLERISDEVAHVEPVDAATAASLVRGVERAAHGWLSTRQRPRGRLADLLDTIPETIALAPPDQRANLWNEALGYVTRHSQTEKVRG